METIPSLDFWWRFAAMLALETSMIVLIAVALQRMTASVVWRRIIWQGCAVGMLALLAVELSGGSDVVAGWMKSPQVPSRASVPAGERSFTVTVGELPGDSKLSGSASTVTPTARGTWWPGALWLLGSVLLLGRMVFIRIFFLLHARGRRAMDDPELLGRVRDLSARLQIRRCVRVLEIRALRGPIAFGIVRPTVGLPKDFLKFTAREQDAMLIHELAHLAARDPIWYSLADVLAALMWWHPLVWWIRRRLQAATEAAADGACVLVEDGPNILAEALVRLGNRLLERQHLGLLGIGGNGFRSDLGRRVERLMRLNQFEWRPVSRVRSWTAKTAGPAALVALTLCCGAWMMPAKERLPNAAWDHSLAGMTLAVVREAVMVRDEIGRGGKQTFVGAESAGEIPKRQRSQTELGERWPRSIYAQLERIRLPVIASEGAPLNEVVNKLSEEVRSHDPEKRGINFIVHSDAAGVVIKISPAVTDTSVGQALNAIVGGADRPLKYSVEPAAIRFALHNPESQQLYTRTFKLDPNRVNKALEVGMLATTNEAQQIAGLMLEHFKKLFVTPKSVFWNDRLGMLMVRATLEDLDAIEKLVQVLNTPPPQVTIDVKIAEMPEAAVKQLGLDWLGATVTATISTNQVRNSFVDTNTVTENYATVLTHSQYRMLVRAMEQRTGVDLLAAPRVTTLSARQAQIKVVEVKSVVTGTAEKPGQSGVHDLVVTQHECGPTVDVAPVVRSDGYTIDLTLIVTSCEFVGYEPTDEVVKVLNDEGGIGSAPKPLPQFRVHQAMATPTVWDGQTFVMGMGRVEGRERVAFVTVTIIDPAGNAVRGEEEGVRTRGIPPQRK